jgi:hypothetical protein
VRPDGSGDFPTIVTAVHAAQSGDEILLGDGTFTGEGNRNVLIESKTLTIRSESGDPARCTIDSSDGLPDVSNRALYFRYTGPSEPVLEGVTITGGDAEVGGGVVAWLSSPRLRNCVFIANESHESGALHFQESAATVEGCVIVQNLATQYPGGGVFCSVNSSVRIVRCTIAQNSAMSWGPGGVASWLSSSVQIEHSIIAASLKGEGVGCDETSTATLMCSNVIGNAGGDWIGCLEGQLGVNGNISADPIFCDPTLLDFTIREDSPCAAEFSACGLMGALPVGCEAISIQPSSWGKIKARYR